MTQDDYREYALELVSRNFNVSVDDILSCRRSEEVVDARCALVHILVFEGVRPGTIEKWTGISLASQSYLLQCFELRKYSSPWFDTQMINLIRDAKRTSPIKFRAHNKDGNVVVHQGAFE